MSDVIPIERLTSRSDLFRCVPYSCILKAGACIERQGAHPMLHGKPQMTRWLYPKCATCVDGGRVVEAITGGVPAMEVDALMDEKPDPPVSEDFTDLVVDSLITDPDGPEDVISLGAMCEYMGCDSPPGPIAHGNQRKTSSGTRPYCSRHRKTIRDSRRPASTHPVKSNGYKEYLPKRAATSDRTHVSLVKEAVEKCGGSVNVLAKRLGVTYNSPMHWLAGRYSPRGEMVKMMEAIVRGEEVLPRQKAQTVAHATVPPIDATSKDFALRLAYKALRDLGNDTAALAIADLILT